MSVRDLLRRFWPIIPIVVIVIGLAVVVQIFKESCWLATWLFSFLNDWAIIIGATATVILATAAFATVFIAIRENRRTSALDRIRSWAEGTFDVFTNPPKAQLPQVLEEIRARLQPCHAKCIGILRDAELQGGDLNTKVKSAYISFCKYLSILGTEEDITTLKEYFKKTDFGDIKPITTTEELGRETKELIAQLTEVVNSATRL